MPGTRPGMTNSLKNKRFSSWRCLSGPSTSGRIRGLRPKIRFIHTLSGGKASFADLFSANLCGANFKKAQDQAVKGRVGAE
jgi:hypothetical protein